MTAPNTRTRPCAATIVGAPARSQKPGVFAVPFPAGRPIDIKWPEACPLRGTSYRAGGQAGAAANKAAVPADLFVKEAWRDWRSGALEGRLPDLERLSLLMIKPDGVVSGKVRPALAYLDRCGFDCLSARIVRLDRVAIRAIWMNDWQGYSLDRLGFCDLLYTAGPALVLLVHDRRGGDPARRAAGDEPLCRLTLLKGSCDPALRRPGQLRSVLGARGRVINHVHVSDTLFDAIRESGILLSRDERADALRRQSAHRIEATVERLEAATIRHELGIVAALRRLPLPVRHAVESGAGLPLEELLSVAIDHRDPVARWDLVALAAEAIEHEEAGGPG